VVCVCNLSRVVPLLVLAERTYLTARLPCARATTCHVHGAAVCFSLHRHSYFATTGYTTDLFLIDWSLASDFRVCPEVQRSIYYVELLAILWERWAANNPINPLNCKEVFGPISDSRVYLMWHGSGDPPIIPSHLRTANLTILGSMQCTGYRCISFPTALSLLLWSWKISSSSS